MSQRSEPLLKNLELVGFHDLCDKPGFQMGLHKSGDRYYLYTATFRSNGFHVLEVTDPAHPRYANWVEGLWVGQARDGQSIAKIQVADGLLIGAHGGQMRELHGVETSDNPFLKGISIWDIATDPENPQLLGTWECGGDVGVHRFWYNGGRYVYTTATCPGYSMFILRIVDIVDPRKPVEVGRFWFDEQYLGNSNTPPVRFGSAEFLASPFIHALTVKDNIAYLAAPNKGLTLVDVSDPTLPKLISRLPLNPPFGGGSAGVPCHTALPLGDRPYAVVTTEGERARYFSNEATDGLFKKIVTQPINTMGIVELVDPAHPNLISIFPYPEVPEGYTHGENFNIVDGVRVPFGPHNLFDVFGPDVYRRVDDRVYCCYFNAGLRVYDVHDPFVPREVAYFLPPDPTRMLFDNATGDLMPGPEVAITEDVLVDDRGYIYVDTFMDGLYILRETAA